MSTPTTTRKAQTAPTPIVHGSGRGTLNWSLSTRRRSFTSNAQDVLVVVGRNEDGVETFRRYMAKHEVQTELTTLDSGDITERCGHLHMRFARTAVTHSLTHLDLRSARLFNLPIPKRLLDITAEISTHGEEIESRICIRLARQITLTYLAHLQKEITS